MSTDRFDRREDGLNEARDIQQEQEAARLETARDGIPENERCKHCEGRGWIMYQRGPDEVDKDICMDCDGTGRAAANKGREQA